MKNSNDTIGNRTRDLLTCSAVPQPTAPPRSPGVGKLLWNVGTYTSIYTASSKYLIFLSVSLNQCPTLDLHSFTYHRRYIIIATDSIIKSDLTSARCKEREKQTACAYWTALRLAATYPSFKWRFLQSNARGIHDARSIPSNLGLSFYATAKCFFFFFCRITNKSTITINL